jgi:hypothetical protein
MNHIQMYRSLTSDAQSWRLRDLARAANNCDDIADFLGDLALVTQFLRQKQADENQLLKLEMHPAFEPENPGDE